MFILHAEIEAEKALTKWTKMCKKATFISITAVQNTLFSKYLRI